MLIINTAEGGSNGTAVSASNSGGESGSAWNAATTTGSGTLTYSNTYAMHGTYSYHSNTTASIGQAFAYWTTRITINPKLMYAQCYVYFPSSPPSVSRFCEFTNSSIQNCGGVGLSSSNKFTLNDAASTTVATSSTTFSNGQWIRLELMVFSDASVGQMELKIFTTPDSTTPTEVLTTAATLNTRGSDIAGMVIGNLSNTVNFDFYFDDIACQDTSYIGPNPYLSPYRASNAEGGTNGAAVTSLNSGGSSGTAWDAVTLGGSGAVTFSTAQAMHGTTSYYINCPSATDTVFLQHTHSLDDLSGAFRFYLYLTALPSNTTDIASFYLSTNNNGAKVQLTSTGAIRLINTATFITFADLSLNTWYRLEAQMVMGTTSSNGTLNFQYYLGDSLTPVNTDSSTTRDVGTSTISGYRFGKMTSNQGSLLAYIDDVAITRNMPYPIGPSTEIPKTSWVTGN